MSEVVTATIRVRMGQQDAHYGGDLVDGARILELFGDLVTEITIRTDGDEGLLTGYGALEFLAPVRAGDFVEATGRLVRRSRLRRTVELQARKVIASRYGESPTAAEFLDEPVLVCRGVGTTVIPAALARRRSSTAPHLVPSTTGVD
ncbi:3-aminobutyryl-CoA ammonia lyase [Saccharopolyspora erythraea]|uniref:acyl-CoA hydrolase n=1 Tax=Saccharopolyspora erythraea TaxID=1836 RepID=UPI001BAC14AE|nr:acyl-CoA hydrolase [Saccharopolyspora erythraea]QUH01522.1 3-aminobutyryl-CoA ammonia lyase [Saccharopolyspora erythraea]